MKLLDELIHNDGEHPEYLVAKARCCISLHRSHGPDAFSLVGSGTPHPLIDTAIRNLEILADRYPDVPDYQSELAEALATLGAFGRHETLSQREPLMRRAIEIAGQLSDKYPSIPRYRACLARALHGLAQSLHRDRRTEESEGFERRAAMLYRELANDFPRVDAYQGLAAQAAFGHGEILRERNLLPASRAALEESVARQLKYLAQKPEDRLRKRAMARHYLSLADTLRRLGETQLAQEMEQNAEQLRSIPAFRMDQLSEASNPASSRARE
jgi:hypothetical protein